MSKFNFLLSNIRSKQQATPAEIYHHFHTKIRDQQLLEFKTLRPIFEILDDTTRQLNLVTEDPEKKKEIALQLDILRKVESKIRERHSQSGAEFLHALDLCLRFNNSN